MRRGDEAILITVEGQASCIAVVFSSRQIKLKVHLKYSILLIEGTISVLVVFFAFEDE